MNKKIKMDGDLNKLLLNTCVASWAIEEKDSQHFLENAPELENLDHEVKNICVSRDYGLNRFA